MLVLLMVPSRQPDPAAARWIAGHPEYGSVGTHFDMAPWAEGERERHITTSGAELVFYLQDGSVVRVDRVDGGRRQVYP